MARAHWPGINPRFMGFGGEEGYVHALVRRQGGRTLCLPDLRWHHRFPRPRGVPYRLNHHDRINNYLAAWRELGWDLRPVHRHFTELLGDTAYDALRVQVEERLDHPGLRFDGVCVCSDDDRVGPWRNALAKLDEHGLAVRRIPMPRGEEGQDWWTKGRRAAAQVAQVRHWRSVVVLDEALPLSADVFYRLADLAARMPGRVVWGTVNERPLAAIVTPGATGQSAAASLLGEPDERVALDAWLTAAEAPLPVAGWSIIPPAALPTWEPSYRAWASIGMGTTMHRLGPVPCLPPETAYLSGWARALREPAALDGPVILLRSGVHASRDLGALLRAALSDLQDRPWDVLSLAASEVETPAFPGSLVGRTSRPASLAVVIHPDARERLLGALPDLDDLDAWDAWDDADADAWLAELAAQAGLATYALVAPALAPAQPRPTDELPYAGRFRRQP
jgi:hypothetical protein